MEYIDVTGGIQSITSYTGFFETLREPESLLHLNNFLTTPGVRNSKLADELRDYTVPTGGPLMAFSWRDKVNGVADFLLGRDLEVTSEEERWIRFKVHSLYCPNIAGASATLTVSNEKQSAGSCRLSVAGVGGGQDVSITFNVSDSFETKEQSIAVHYEFLTVWQECDLIDLDGSRTHFPRLKEVLRKSRRVVLPLASPVEPPRDWGEVVDEQGLDLREVTASAKHKLSIASGSQWEASAEVDIAGVKFGPKYTMAMKWTTEIECSLPPGTNYLARRFRKMPWWWWSMDPG